MSDLLVLMFDHYQNPIDNLHFDQMIDYRTKYLVLYRHRSKKVQNSHLDKKHLYSVK